MLLVCSLGAIILLSTIVAVSTRGRGGGSGMQGKKEEDTLASKRKEGVRLKRKAEEDRRVGLFAACRAGFVEEVSQPAAAGRREERRTGSTKEWNCGGEEWSCRRKG